MIYNVRYDIKVKAEDEKHLQYSLSLLEHYIKIKDKDFIREIIDNSADTEYVIHKTKQLQESN